MNRKSEELKEKQISEVMASIENRVRHAYNQGYEQGLKDSKPESCEQIKWERDTAIKQLNEVGYGLGEKIKPCDDAISRQAVLEEIDVKAWEFCDYLISKNRNDEQKPVSHFADNLRECIREDLPSVQPQEPKTGHWIEEDMFDGDVAYRCSECNTLFWIESGTPKDNEYNFCPHCGAKMESEDKA